MERGRDEGTERETETQRKWEWGPNLLYYCFQNSSAPVVTAALRLAKTAESDGLKDAGGFSYFFGGLYVCINALVGVLDIWSKDTAAVPHLFCSGVRFSLILG